MMRLPIRMWKRTLAALGFVDHRGSMANSPGRQRRLGVESLERRALLCSLPTISLAVSSEVTEGSPIEVTVSLSEPSNQPVSVSISTMDQTASTPSDYETISADLVCSRATSHRFQITTAIDNVSEGDETLRSC
jgi:hypothetical protein